MLEVSGLRKFYGPTGALKWAEEDSVVFQPGRVHALAGENGAGKSTLMKVISGLERKTSGNMRLAGSAYEPASIAEARQHGVEIVLQESGLVPTMTVAENLFLGREREFSNGGVINHVKVRRATREAMGRVNRSVSPNATVATLDLETQKFVELARALAYDPKVLIIDEMTASLGSKGVTDLKQIMASRAQAGSAVLFISHYLDEVFELCDEVTVLRDGRLIASLATSEATEENLHTLMVGRSLVGELYREEKQSSPREQVVLQVDNLVIPGRVSKSSFVVRQGEILGLGGLVGCGVEDLAMTLYGMGQPSEGAVRVNDKPVELNSSRSAIKAGIAYVTADRERNDLLLQLPIQDNMALPNLPWRTKMGMVSRKADAKAASDVIAGLRIACNGPTDLPGNLSGGNRQKVVLGRWLLRKFPVLMLHNPTRGVDVGAKAEIYGLMRDLAAEGAAILLISDELNELIGMADRVLMMRRGIFTAEFSEKSTMTEEALVECMI